MYLIESRIGEAARAFAVLPKPFGPAFPQELAARLDKIEVHGTNFNDPGPDFCEFRAFAGDTPLHTKRVWGY
jgi:hypothetical protein